MQKRAERVAHPGVDRPEIEWQFDVRDPGALRRWLATHAPVAGVALGRERTARIIDVYYDTDDWRLHRAGWALRVRRIGARTEATMKSLGRTRGARQERREITVAIGGHRTTGGAARAASVPEVPSPAPDVVERPASLPGLLGARLRLVAGRRRLRRVLELRTSRRALALTIGGRQAGELALDETSIPGAEHGAPRLLHVEVEVGAAAPTALEPFVVALSHACDLKPAAGSKYELGLAALGTGPASIADLGPVEIGPAMTAGEVAFAVLRRSCAALLAHEGGARLGDDPEALHQMRVATRRLRADTKSFREALPPGALVLHTTLGWIANALGAVRDLDVQIDQLRAGCAEMDPGEAAALESVAALLRERRLAARRDMLRVLDAPRYDRFVAAYTRMLRDGPAQRIAFAQRPILDVAPDLVARRYRRMKRTGDRLTRRSSASDYHQFRIRVKRLRFALEACAEFYGRPARRMLRGLTKLQRVLGRHQDAQVAVANVRGLARPSGALGRAALFAIGRIAERYDREAAELRSRFPARYRKVRGRRWEGLRRAMKKRRPAVILRQPPTPRPRAPRPHGPSHTKTRARGAA